MKFNKYNPKLQENTVALKDTKPGDTLRFAHDSIEEAFKADLFWFRLDAPEHKDRVRLANLADGKQIERDGDHRVVVLKTHLSIEI